MQPSSRQPIYWGIGLILGSLILGAAAMALWPVGSGAWDWHSGMMGGYGWWGWSGALMMTLGMLSMAAFWFGVILLAVWAIRAIAPRSEASTGTPSALEIAKARYARGEITKAEFEEIRRAIE